MKIAKPLSWLLTARGVAELEYIDTFLGKYVGTFSELIRQQQIFDSIDAYVEEGERKLKDLKGTEVKEQNKATPQRIAQLHGAIEIHEKMVTKSQKSRNNKSKELHQTRIDKVKESRVTFFRMQHHFFTTTLEKGESESSMSIKRKGSTSSGKTASDTGVEGIRNIIACLENLSKNFEAYLKTQEEADRDLSMWSSTEDEHIKKDVGTIVAFHKLIGQNAALLNMKFKEYLIMWHTLEGNEVSLEKSRVKYFNNHVTL
jgi:hypothetical protein